tara:strand:- start:14 stop:358 length:345 start_codon:yes stop_codon:yes gene_type:complete
MPLSKSDTSRLVDITGLEPNSFSHVVDGIRILLNDSATKACVFLDTDSMDVNAPGTCSVYEHRPIGCQSYPLILNDEDEAFLDELCPHREAFPEAPPALLLMLRKLDAEIQGQS